MKLSMLTFEMKPSTCTLTVALLFTSTTIEYLHPGSSGGGSNSGGGGGGDSGGGSSRRGISVNTHDSNKKKEAMK